jgi:hypothetical protein
MREHQIGTAAVNVKMVAQLFAVHRRALNMPSRTDLDQLQAGARVDVVDVKRNPMDFVLWKMSKEGEQTVVRVCRHIEHYVAVIRHIGMAFGDQLLGNLGIFCVPTASRARRIILRRSSRLPSN